MRLPTSDVAALLKAWDDREPEALDRLFESCRTDLRRIARGLLRGERPHHTLQPTALVNEAYLRLFDGAPPEWPDAEAFFGSVAREMRRALVDYARRRLATKRGGRTRIVPLVLAGDPGRTVDPTDMLALDQALERLAATHRRAATVVEMRYVAGLSSEEVAALLGVTRRTVERDWAWARACLYGDLYGTRA